MELNDYKRQIHEYVESRMTFIAPNLSIIVGASTAAKLMGKSSVNTLMCLSIGTPKNNKFSICSKWKIHYFQVSQNLDRVLGQLKIINFPFETNGKLMRLGVPIFKHFRVRCIQHHGPTRPPLYSFV